MSGDHKGIDIGAETGTIIKSAMSGKVTLVSEEGGYRETFRNNRWRNIYFVCTL